MKQLLANMRHAVRNNETTIIGGGEFSPTELKEFLKQVEFIHSIAIMNSELHPDIAERIKGYWSE